MSTREYPVSTPLQSEDELGAVVQLNASLEKMISAKEVQINVYHHSTLGAGDRSARPARLCPPCPPCAMLCFFVALLHRGIAE